MVNAHRLSVPLQFGSFALYGLYLIIKYYGNEWINAVLKWYFAATGVGSVWSVRIISNLLHMPTHVFTTEFQALRSFVRCMVGKARWQSFEKHSLKYTKGDSKGRQFGPKFDRV